MGSCKNPNGVDYSKYRCPFDHIEKDCGHKLIGPEGYQDAYSVWCACGFRGPVFALDPVALGLRPIAPDVDALGLPADSAPETVAEAVETHRVVVPELMAEDREAIFPAPDLAENEQGYREFWRVFDKAFAIAASRSRAIPADRALGEGMVAVDAKELNALRELRAALLQALRCQHMRDWYRMTKRLGDALDASHHPPVLRANQGGAAT